MICLGKEWEAWLALYLTQVGLSMATLRFFSNHSMRLYQSSAH